MSNIMRRPPSDHERGTSFSTPAEAEHPQLTSDFVGPRVEITCNGACFSSFRECCSHYGPPETLFAFGKRLIPATPHHAVLQWTWFSDHASTVETFGVTASDISPSWKSQRIPMITVSNKRRSTAVSP
jgi:hypothetical protein